MHLVAFTIEIYYDARFYIRQIYYVYFVRRTCQLVTYVLVKNVTDVHAVVSAEPPLISAATYTELLAPYTSPSCTLYPRISVSINISINGVFATPTKHI